MNEVLFPYFCVSLSLANEFELNINGNNKMKKLKVLALALICAVFSPAKADEGGAEPCRPYEGARFED